MTRRPAHPSRREDGRASRNALKDKLRPGFFVFGVLMVLEVAEYLLGTTMKSSSWPFLAILAVVAAWPIVHYFMHIMQLKGPEE